MGPYAPTWPNHVRGRAGVEPPPKGVEFIALGSWPRTGERTHTMYAAPPDPKGKIPKWSENQWMQGFAPCAQINGHPYRPPLVRAVGGDAKVHGIPQHFTVFCTPTREPTRSPCSLGLRPCRPPNVASHMSSG